jgi:hypothetical protein
MLLAQAFVINVSFAYFNAQVTNVISPLADSPAGHPPQSAINLPGPCVRKV